MHKPPRVVYPRGSLKGHSHSYRVEMWKGYAYGQRYFLKT